VTLFDRRTAVGLLVLDLLMPLAFADSLERPLRAARPGRPARVTARDRSRC